MKVEEFNDHPAILIGSDNKTLNRMWSAKRTAVDNTSEYAKLTPYSRSIPCADA